ncbi:MAG: tetratricopeptide repeat protein [Bacteroidales bacterium]|nr:tetratricopeptide repeat protein [Bacteroidales bacterium]
MKRILMVMALAAACICANAQVKSASAASSALQKAKEDTENPKKNTKFTTWMKYGQALVNAYDSPYGNGWIGASRQDLQLLNNEKPLSSEQVVLGGEQLVKEVYPTRNEYYNGAGLLSMVEITKPIVEDALPQAAAAYAKAGELDPKCSKAKDIKAALKSIGTKLVEKAYASYTLGDYKQASVDFENAALAVSYAPLSEIDSNSVYNAGFTAWFVGDNERAKKFFNECLKFGYYSEDGEVYSKLADIATKEGKGEESKDILEEGFKKFPQSQSILVGLINYYVSSNGSTDRLFELLGEAKKNEPNNASLYYVEGNICEKLGLTEKAIESYRQCAKIDPNYAYGYIGEGILYYNLALKYQEEAQNEMNDAKYRALIQEFEETLKNCIPAFESALELVDDQATRQGVAEYLKNACFRFRTDDEYAEKYKKYEAMMAGN